MTARMPVRIVWVGGEPTPYREPHLAALAAHPDVDLHVVYPRRSIQRRTWAVHQTPTRVTYLRGPSFPATGLLHHDYPLTPGIIPLLERERPDVVVVSGWALMATQLAVAWCGLRGTPYLLASDSHGDEPRAAWIRHLKQMALPPIVGGASGWLVPGTLAAEYVQEYGATPEQTIVFPLTIDVASMAEIAKRLGPQRESLRGRFCASPDEIVVLQVGRLVPFKAADVLIRATALAAGQSSESIRLVLVGDGPEESRLKTLAASLGTSATFAGMLEGDDLASAYVAADIFALVSRRETWGVVVNEAMACGLPLVLSDRVGAARDLLRAGENGELVRADDRGALAGALVALARDPRRRARYGKRSRELIEPWCYETSVEAMADLARRVTDARRSRRTTRASDR